MADEVPHDFKTPKETLNVDENGNFSEIKYFEQIQGP